MAGTFNQAMNGTESDFDKFVKPVIPYMFNGNLIPVEGDTGNIAKILDTQCGIDYILDYNGLLYGVASRIQRVEGGRRPWNTFSVRNERDNGTTTEYEKRIKNIFGQSIYPKITYQAYVSSDGKLQSMAVGFTEDIIACCALGKYTMRHTGSAQVGQASFMAVDWNVMRRSGYTLRTYSLNRGLIQHHEKGKTFDLYSLDENGMPNVYLQSPTQGFES